MEPSLQFNWLCEADSDFGIAVFVLGENQYKQAFPSYAQAERTYQLIVNAYSFGLERGKQHNADTDA